MYYDEDFCDSEFIKYCEFFNVDRLIVEIVVVWFKFEFCRECF